MTAATPLHPDRPLTGRDLSSFLEAILSGLTATREAESDESAADVTGWLSTLMAGHDHWSGPPAELLALLGGPDIGPLATPLRLLTHLRTHEAHIRAATGLTVRVTRERPDGSGRRRHQVTIARAPAPTGDPAARPADGKAAPDPHADANRRVADSFARWADRHPDEAREAIARATAPTSASGSADAEGAALLHLELIGGVLALACRMCAAFAERHRDGTDPGGRPGRDGAEAQNGTDQFRRWVRIVTVAGAECGWAAADLNGSLPQCFDFRDAPPADALAALADAARGL